jgi:hypothetical protein
MWLGVGHLSSRDKKNCTTGGARRVVYGVYARLGCILSVSLQGPRGIGDTFVMRKPQKQQKVAMLLPVALKSRELRQGCEKRVLQASFGQASTAANPQWDLRGVGTAVRVSVAWRSC